MAKDRNTGFTMTADQIEKEIRRHEHEVAYLTAWLDDSEHTAEYTQKWLQRATHQRKAKELREQLSTISKF